MVRDEDMHFIGMDAEMKKPVKLKDIIAFNEKQLKMIEMNNIKLTSNETLADLSKSVLQKKK